MVRYLLVSKANREQIKNYASHIIIETERACALHYSKNKTYDILTEECPDHPFNNRKDKNQLNEKSEYDMRFLIQRLGRAKRAKEMKIFAIFFTAYEYYNIAISIQRYLRHIGRSANCIYLEDISNERMTCYLSVEAAIVVNCEFFMREIDSHLLILYPCDLMVAFGEFDISNYSPNYFNEKNITIEYVESDLIKYDEMAASKYINERHMKETVDYYGETDEVKINEGRDGIAGNYK